MARTTKNSSGARNSKSSTRIRKSLTKTSNLYITQKAGFGEIFFGIIMPKLKRLQFKVELGKRSGDFFIFPPGVTRLNGKKRLDFFDSYRGCVEFLKKDNKYSRIMKLLMACMDTYDERKLSKDLPELSLRQLQIETVKNDPSLKM
mmetsp:Transcript_2999/g.2888  ORF Transcript_2999/g.2888 Transcript_2999/m.2888 type:complete len:146 (-) Transcript_2999:43-480(-)